MSIPDFRTIHPDMIDSAWEAWKEGSASRIMCLVDHLERGKLLMDNIKAFRDHGIYEAALVCCYVSVVRSTV